MSGHHEPLKITILFFESSERLPLGHHDTATEQLQKAQASSSHQAASINSTRLELLARTPSPWLGTSLQEKKTQF
jgi:hypothetical protein